MIERVLIQKDQYVVAAGPARAQLGRILARPEFSAATREPAAWERMLNRWNAQLRQWLMHLLAGIANHPTGWRIFFFVALIAAVAGLVYLAIRWMDRDRNLLRLPAPSSALASSAESWLAAARESAARGDYRRAIHCAYWAAIARLHDSGAIARYREATPREYLRHLRKAAGSGQSRQLEALTALTMQLEQFWYGRMTAGAEEWSRTSLLLENFGWRPE